MSVNWSWDKKLGTVTTTIPDIGGECTYTLMFGDNNYITILYLYEKDGEEYYNFCGWIGNERTKAGTTKNVTELFDRWFDRGENVISAEVNTKYKDMTPFINGLLKSKQSECLKNINIIVNDGEQET